MIIVFFFVSKKVLKFIAYDQQTRDDTANNCIKRLFFAEMPNKRPLPRHSLQELEAGARAGHEI